MAQTPADSHVRSPADTVPQASPDAQPPEQVAKKFFPMLDLEQESMRGLKVLCGKGDYGAALAAFRDHLVEKCSRLPSELYKFNNLQ